MADVLTPGDWVEVPRGDKLVVAEVLATIDARHRGSPDAQTIVTLQDVNDGSVFSSSLESCVEVDAE